MIKVEALQEFTLERFGEIKNLQRGTLKRQKGWLYKTDVFECDKELCDYLLEDNPIKKAVVKVIEIVPEKVEDAKIEENASNIKQDANIQVEKPKATPKKSTKKKTSKK